MYALDTPFEDLLILKPKGWAPYTPYNSSIPPRHGSSLNCCEIFDRGSRQFLWVDGVLGSLLCVVSLMFVSLDGCQLSGKGRNGNSNDVPGTTYGQWVGLNDRDAAIDIGFDGNGNPIALAYGADGYLESIRALQGHRLTFYYDPQTHHVTSSRDGRGHSVSYEHDQVDNLVSVANAKGITSNLTYDRKSNLASGTFP